MKRLIAIAAGAALLSLPAVDAWFASAMVRVMLLELPLWALLGALAARSRRTAWSLSASLAALVFALGAIAFWLLPRSLDVAQSEAGADHLMHASLFLAGAALAVSLPRTPLTVRLALGLYTCSMVFAMGMFYVSFDALVCGAFDRRQQLVLGSWLLRLTAPLTLAFLIAAVRGLSRLEEAHPAATGATLEVGAP